MASTYDFADIKLQSERPSARQFAAEGRDVENPAYVAAQQELSAREDAYLALKMLQKQGVERIGIAITTAEYRVKTAMANPVLGETKESAFNMADDYFGVVDRALEKQGNPGLRVANPYTKDFGVAELHSDRPTQRQFADTEERFAIDPAYIAARQELAAREDAYLALKMLQKQGVGSLGNALAIAERRVKTAAITNPTAAAGYLRAVDKMLANSTKSLGI
jgi:hypothetical protein